ncbi:hypothetical protein PVAP13_3KG373435 [Panicum virgatum]|uniref:Uncharacterized protein n=1 Tax=Panicum virgatum TaxID=38727 RepID=A0A8T0UV09_PANVG|nr:hypothetical protein PVAP13_3KG373435 [Panicum virgatum]
MDSSSHLQSFHKLIDGSETVLTLDVSSNGAGSLFELISNSTLLNFVLLFPHLESHQFILSLWINGSKPRIALGQRESI